MKGNSQGRVRKPAEVSKGKLSESSKSSPRNSNSAEEPSRRIYFFLGGILLLTIILYFDSFKGAILNWDDRVYIPFNTTIQKLSSANIREMFSGFYASNYHPLTSLSWALEYSIAGVDKVFIYHIDNLLLHLMNTVLVFVLFRKISRNNSIALIIALLHAIHPMHVESVAWISERKDLLYTFFFLLSIIMYYDYLVETNFISNGALSVSKRKNKAFLFISASIAFFILSLFSKSAAVVLPAVLFLIDFLLKRKLTKALFLEKIPFIALSILFGILALKSQKNVINDLPEFSFLQRTLIINHSFWRYVWMAFFPFGLSAYHPWPTLNNGSLATIYYISPVFTIGLIGYIIFSLKKSRVVVFGMIFFLVNLLLVIQIIPVGVAVIAERYSYVSYLGIFFIVATLVAGELSVKGKTDSLRTKVLTAILILATAGFSFATFNRIGIWKSDRNLWDDMISHYPSTAYIAYYNRAKYWHENNNEQAAIIDLNKLIEWKKYYSESLTMRGSIEEDSGNREQALSDYNEAIAYDSAYFLSYNNRGSVRLKMNDLNGAMTDLDKAIVLKKDYYQAWYNRGVVKIGLKDFIGGMEDLRQCQRLNPSYCLAFYGMGNAFSSQGKFNEAKDFFSQAIDCDGKFTDAYINRGNMKIQLSDFRGAEEDFSKVIELDPNYSYAYFNRGRIKVQLNDFEGAEKDLQQTVTLNPNFSDTYVVWGNLKFSRGDRAGACGEWRRGAEKGNQICSGNLEAYCK